jgi:NAD(P)-dependent dehydrogenase (short-subunit alcohol dehydrogenase family)
MSTDFDDKVVVVTGGSQGIGLAAAKRFASRGARIIVSARTLERARDAAKGLGPEARGLALLQQSPESCAMFVKAVVAHAGRVDVLVNNAGVFPRGTVADMNKAVWYEALDVNLTGVFLLTQGFLPHLSRPGATIVNIVSGLAVTGGYASGAYAASKAGVIALTRTLGIELAAVGIRANALSPGIVDTHLLNTAYSQTERARVLVGLGGKAGDPNDIAGSIAYLASADSHPMTGQTIFIRSPVALGLP